MVIKLQNIVMRAKGFKKVLLKDTKGVLTNKNNFKWVKETDDFVETVLPTGTKIYKNADYKYVAKPDGTAFSYTRFDINHKIDEFSPFRLKKGTANKCRYIFDSTIIKERTLEESRKLRADNIAKTLRSKREKFVQDFNEKFERVIKRDKEGNISKETFERGTNRLVAWFKKDKKTGDWSRGNIKYLPGNFGKTVYTESSKGKVIETTTKAMGNEKVTRIEIPNGDLSKATSTTIEKTKSPTAEEYQSFLHQLSGAFDEIASKIN